MSPVIIGIIVVVGVLLLLILWVAFIYNALVRGRNHCDEAWSGIDTELKRRYDLIPNLVNTVKGYASQGSPASQAKDENVLVDSLKRLLVVVESYPDLKASQNFLKLQQELVNTEDRIQRARRFYNGNVRDYNNRVQVIPSALIAGPFGFKEREFFEIESAVERQAPVVKM
jgi:LemA protein